MTAPHDDAREALRVIRAARADGIKLWLQNGQVYAAPRGDKLDRHRPALDKHYDAIAALLKENPELGRPAPSSEVPGPPSEEARPGPAPQPETELGLNSGAKPPDGAARDEAKSQKRHAKLSQPDPSRLNDSGARVPITSATLHDALSRACAEVGSRRSGRSRRWSVAQDRYQRRPPGPGRWPHQAVPRRRGRDRLQLEGRNPPLLRR